MKKAVWVVMFAALMLGGVAAQADIVRYQFSFTGADLMTIVYGTGNDGLSAAQVGIYDGARLVRQNLVSGYTYTRSYVDTQDGAFQSWASSTTDRLLGFNLWGLDGRGAGWGEDFKPTDWVSTSDNGNWTEWSSSWSAAGWGTPPAGYITEELVGWDASTYGDTLGFGDANLASQVFTFTVDIDTNNAFWGQNTYGAPNTLPELTFWFGGYMGSENVYNDAAWAGGYIYEGNMVLTGTAVPVPEPASIALLGLGLAGLAVQRIRKRA